MYIHIYYVYIRVIYTNIYFDTQIYSHFIGYEAVLPFNNKHVR